MPQNTNPIFTIVPHVEWGSTDGNAGAAGPLKTANTAMDGTGTVLTIFTAGGNGSYIRRIIARPAGTNVASVLRVFLNNGLTNATLANNTLIAEASLLASTASSTLPLQPVEVPVNEAIPAGYKINVTLGTTVAAGYIPTAIGGDY